MKKRICALLLTLALLLGALAPAALALDGVSNTPIITIPGTSNVHIANEAGERIVPDDVGVDTILGDRALVTSLLRQFAKSIVTNRWDPYCDMLVDTLAPIWAPAVFDANGEPQHGDHIMGSFRPDYAREKTGAFSTSDYVFQYDWRLDPLVIADQLETYVDAVRRATGADKVTLVGRCYGANVMSAYLSKYGCDKVNCAVYYCSLALGNEQVDAVFTGRISLDPDTVDQYLNYYLTDQKPVEDDDLTGFLASLVTVLNYTATLDVTTWTVEKLLAKFKDNILPRILRASYGSYPGYWAMVSDEAYEEAKQYVFGGVEAEYAGMIAKLDAYHYGVMTRMDELLDRCDASGMNVTVITKYNTPAYPIFEGSNYQSDNSCSLAKQSFGAVSSDIESTLDDAYIAEREALGYGKYLSADRKIDASTARYPDTTWFFKDLGHTEHPAFVMGLIERAADAPAGAPFTVDSDSAYPQFMRKTAPNAFAPVTPEDASDAKWQKTPFFRSLRNMIASLFRFLRTFFRSRRQA